MDVTNFYAASSFLKERLIEFLVSLSSGCVSASGCDGPIIQIEALYVQCYNGITKPLPNQTYLRECNSWIKYKGTSFRRAGTKSKEVN